MASSVGCSLDKLMVLNQEMCERFNIVEKDSAGLLMGNRERGANLPVHYDVLDEGWVEVVFNDA